MINPGLYQLLCEAVKRGNLRGNEVEVRNEDELMIASYYGDPAKPDRVRMVPEYSGETFSVCCPGCNDDRYRLSINHRWGVYDARTGNRNWWLVHCFNEECQRQYEFIKGLRRRIDPLRSRLGDIKLAEPTPGDPNASPTQLQPMSIPLGARPLGELDADHPGKKFLSDRGHNVDCLDQSFGVLWAEEGDNPVVRRRLIFPFTQNGVAGWQARYVDAAGNGPIGDVKGLYRCLSRSCSRFIRGQSRPGECPYCGYDRVRAEMKWYTPRGMKKSQMLFNYDVAAQWPFVVICEGPLDVCRLGSPAWPDLRGPGVAAFGHSLSGWHRRLIAQTWQTAILLFDGELWDDPRERQTLEKTASTLSDLLPGGVVSVRLPNGVDPGDLDHDYLWSQIMVQTAAAGLDLMNVV